MTTIVYDGKTLAVDSQQTQGSTICGLRNKIQDVGKYWLAGCGTADRNSPGVDWGAKTCQLAFCLDAWMSVCDELGVVMKAIMTERDIEQSKASWVNAFVLRDLQRQLFEL